MNAIIIIPSAAITINHTFAPVLAKSLPGFTSVVAAETTGTAGDDGITGGVGGKILGGIVIVKGTA